MQKKHGEGAIVEKFMQKKLRLEKLNLCYQCGKGQGSLGVKQVVRTALK